MNPKTLRYIMGHSDISVTLNTYTHVNFEDAKDELERILSCLRACIGVDGKTKSFTMIFTIFARE